MQRYVKKITYWVCFLLFCFSNSTLASTDYGDVLQISLSSKNYLAKSTKFNVHLSIKNSSNRDLHILKWRIPFNNNVETKMFTVTLNSNIVPYTGKLVKRRPPGSDDYFLLKKGATIEANLDLSQTYNMSNVGIYSFQFKLNYLDILDINSAKMIPEQIGDEMIFKSNKLTIELTSPIPNIKRYKTPNFTGCTTAQQNTLDSAFTASQQIALTAKNGIDNAPVDERSGAIRYIEWFGDYTSSRYSIIQDHFTKIEDALSNQQVTFVCDCTKNYYAYVYPNQPYEIHLCNAFWGAPLNGTDSQAGTIIHETSHFTVVSGTDDHVYGQSECRNLADSNPVQAISNADSHEYFSENNPYLSMPQPASLTVFEFWKRADPIYASVHNESNNFDAQFKIRNDSSSSITIDDIAIHVLKDGSNLFDCWRKDSPTTISGNGTYEIGRHFCEIYNSGNYSTEARLRINGQWGTYESLSFTVLDQQSSFPDLVVESPSVDDNTLSPGEDFKIFATVRNAGNATSTATTLGYYLSSNSTISTGDTEIGTDSISALSAGATSPEDKGNRDAPSNPGTYWVGACVDSVNGESNTGNNCSSGVQITVSNSAYPDLIVESPSVDDNTLSPGEDFKIFVTVRNEGNASSAATTLRYYLSSNSTISTGDSEIGTDSVSALSAGATSPEDKGNRNAPNTPGTYWVGACVDSVSGESNTGNNCSSGVQINVSTPPPSTPSPPSATNGTYSDRVRITWSNVSSATTYKMYRCTNTSTGSCSYLTSDPASPYDDMGGTAGTTYYYRIKASNSAGDSGYSSYDIGFKSGRVPDINIIPILQLLLLHQKTSEFNGLEWQDVNSS